MTTMSKKCLICEQRPAPENSPYCKICGSRVQAEIRRRKTSGPEWYFTYRGHVVGLYRKGDELLTPRLLKRQADKLPKRNTIDLNKYQAGYTREQIKKFKRCVMRLSSISVVRITLY